MDEGRGQDHYEERLQEVFNSFDTSGCGSLSSEELSDLCRSLHLDDATPALLHRLLQNQDHLRVDFDQFKDALILVLSSTIDPPPAEHESFRTSGGSPEIQPKFVKGGKRYGRRSTPEFMEPDLCDVPALNPGDDLDLEDNDDSAVPRKRERWNARGSSSEEYEAEGQMHLWNPDEPSAPRGSAASLSGRLEERLREACDELAIAWDGRAARDDLLTLCEHLDLQLNGDVLLSLSSDGALNVQDFVSLILNHNKPPTPSASTPYRQLKRQHSTQPFDEEGRRSSAMPSTIGVRLFSLLDDGSGFTQTESILDVWTEEGIENSAEILQALNFDVEGKLSLGDLTAALENELLVTKNVIFQAALASFKAEIRHLRERVDQEVREKEKVQFVLERAEKQKSQLAAEVDEHHSAIEHTNNVNLRKLEQDYKEKLAAVRSELVKEMEQLQQQAVLQREELGAEMEKIREDDALLRHHLSVSVNENRRLEVDLLDCTEKLAEARSHMSALQTNLENIMKDKFGDLDPGSADLLYEERVQQLHSSYQVQCRELQDRIDELQAELQGLRVLDRAHEPCGKTLSDELESKSPGTESDPGIGSDEVQPFSMSLEAEMMLEQLKEQHRQEMEDLRNQLENEISEFGRIVEKQKTAHEDQKAALMLQHQQEVQMLKERVASLQSQLQQAVEEHTCLEENQVAEREEQKQREEEVGNLRQQLLEAHTHIADLEDQLNTLEDQQAETDENFLTEMEELRNQHAVEMRKLKEERADLLEATLAEKRNELQELKTELEREKDVLTERHQNALKVQLEEAKQKFEEEREETVKSLNERWQKDREEENNESLQVLLEEETLRLVRKQEEKEKQLREQWESERAQLQEHHEEVLLHSRAEERLQLQEEFELRENRLKEKLELEKEQRVEMLLEEERALLEENHREAVKELMEKHAEERKALGAELTDLRHDVAQERSAASCLAEENAALRKTIAALKEGDFKKFQEELTRTLEDLRNEKFVAQQAADDLKKQISELSFQSHSLEDENEMLTEKNAQNAAGMESMRQQLLELLKETQKREVDRAADRKKMAACVSALEAQLTKALEDTAQLEKRNVQLSQQLSELREKTFQVDLMESRLGHLEDERRTAEEEAAGLRSQLGRAQEKARAVDESLQAVNRQTSRLKSELQVLQQERDFLKHEVSVLHKQLQNSSSKNHILEMALHSSGSQNLSKKLFREELSRLMGQEQQLLRQENSRLQAEVHIIKSSLLQSKEKVRQLDATVLLLNKHKQQSQLSAVKALEEENASLKQELELAKGCEVGRDQADVESLQQENEALRAQMAQLSSQVLESFQAQWGGLLPPAPHRVQRGPHRGEEPDHLQAERERKMRVMEQRMKEIELSLRNVKLLLKEKVAQLKDQLHRNGKADVLIKDLYTENTQLLKALEITEQRQKMAEKKNYLLEEKISSLNKIVRDLNPSTLPGSSYNYQYQ
ncbi:ninein [Nematolebias whitei]|uniref:ninein n=1 Tax=Nematolebias whitei TaxID=451745 RepID=UPI001898169F|nr:ninein [Nematolebias whitei]